MRRILVFFLLFSWVQGISSLHAQGNSYEKPSYDTRSVEKQRKIEQKNTVQAYRRGAIRSPRRSFNPGVGPGRTAPSRQDQGGRNPAAARTSPAQRTGFGGFFGGLFGGLALGTIFSSLFNPFAGFSLGSPLLSLLSIVLWLIVIISLFRMFRSRKKY
ncbi:hypothetical protein [Paenibacillus glycinis]|uniref:Preprotein translocase subunit Tim44 n=1 Tax=Paenibacillus glycinis TaxID=2697035 RepID=A0ABW9XKB0_9BACL|nr:hypothetical protein [Paenibacillus glycinis]NBD23047.1 hypothetical protein [Paenibacillus glycinis]